MSFTENMREALASALVVVIAVGTPAKRNGAADVSSVEEVATSIARMLAAYKVIVTKSTVPVGTGDRIRAIMETESTGTPAFDVVSNPEFLREGAAIKDFLEPDRLVIGTESQRARNIMADVYRPLLDRKAPCLFTNLRTAELIKYASNSFLATKISFINEMSELCESIGADIEGVAAGMGLDRRIGRGFLNPGPGYGGSCFPKDVAALLKLGREMNCPLHVSEATTRTNRRQRQRMFAKISATLGGTVRSRRVAMLGLTFKADTDDIRESPACDLTQWLLDEGADVQAYDPAGMDHASRLFPRLRLAADPYAAAEQADVLVIATEWQEFRLVDLQRLTHVMRHRAIVDLRNLLDPSHVKHHGFAYISLGRFA